MKATNRYVIINADNKAVVYIKAKSADEVKRAADKWAVAQDGCKIDWSKHIICQIYR